MPSTSYTNVSTAGALSDDIKAIDLDSQAGTGGGNVYTITLTAGARLGEFADLSAINLKGADTLVIDGGSPTTILDGQGRGLSAALAASAAAVEAAQGLA